MTIFDLIARAKALPLNDATGLHGKSPDDVTAALAIVADLAKIDARPASVVRSLADGMDYTDASNAGLIDAASYCAEWERDHGIRTREEDE